MLEILLNECISDVDGRVRDDGRRLCASAMGRITYAFDFLADSQMSEPLDIEAIENREKAATFGPWGWFGQVKRPMLATFTGGRVHVMGTARSGMNQATFLFNTERCLKKAEVFAVRERDYRDELDGYNEGITIIPTPSSSRTRAPTFPRLSQRCADYVR